MGEHAKLTGAPALMPMPFVIPVMQVGAEEVVGLALEAFQDWRLLRVVDPRIGVRRGVCGLLQDCHSSQVPPVWHRSGE